MVGLSEEDIERIQSFANTPRYQRNPSSLMPKDERDDAPERETERTDGEGKDGRPRKREESDE